MRVLAPEVVASLLSDDADEPLLACVRIHGEGLDDICIVNNTESITKDGLIYEPYPIEIELPNDDESGAVTCKISVDNVDKEVTKRLREYQGIPNIDVEIVLASDTSVTELAAYDFVLKDMNYNAVVISGTLGYESNVLMQSANKDRYNPSNSPGMFV